MWLGLMIDSVGSDIDRKAKSEKEKGKSNQHHAALCIYARKKSMLKLSISSGVNLYMHVCTECLSTKILEYDVSNTTGPFKFGLLKYAKKLRSSALKYATIRT